MGHGAGGDGRRRIRTEGCRRYPPAAGPADLEGRRLGRRRTLFAHVLEERVHAVGGGSCRVQGAEHLHHRTLLVAYDKEPPLLCVLDDSVRYRTLGGWRKR